MKRILIALTALILCCNAIAQTKMTGTPVQKIPHKSQYNMGNYIVMTDGKMTAMINGESIPMKQTKTMTNGTMVMTNDTLKTKSGIRVMLKEGQCITMDGKIKNMPAKMGLMKD